MNTGKISVRYARALYLLAQEKTILEEVKKDISLIHEVFASSRELENYLKNPVVVHSEKYALIHRVFENAVNPLTMKFLELVLEKKRENHIRDIARMFLLQFKKQKGITDIYLSTAVQVDASTVERITQLLKKEKGKVEVHKKIDPELIGGFILRIDDLQMDASVTSLLRKIGRELSGEGYRK